MLTRLHGLHVKTSQNNAIFLLPWNLNMEGLNMEFHVKRLNVESMLNPPRPGTSCETTGFQG